MSLSRTIRATAVLLATLLVAGPLASVVHGAVESHSYCAEHDAIEHGGEASAEPALASRDDRWQAAEPEDDHHACAFADAFLRPALPGTQSVAPLCADGAHAPAARPAGTHTPAIACLAQAPKTSPPVTLA